jgi:hypothetical protein
MGDNLRIHVGAGKALSPDDAPFVTVGPAVAFGPGKTLSIALDLREYWVGHRWREITVDSALHSTSRDLGRGRKPYRSIQLQFGVTFPRESDR